MTAKPDVPNLDATPDSDLQVFLRRTDLADLWRVKPTTANTLKVYMANILQARTARLAGKIEEALLVEARNDRLYRMLPRGVRW